MKHTYKTQNTCSSEISFELNQGIVSDIQFTGGCNGNLKAITILLEGQKAEDIIPKLKGLTCGRRPTSCADQLVHALESATN